MSIEQDKSADRPPPTREHEPPDKAHQDDMLDEALEDTFPASDPPALTPNNDPEPKGSH